MTTPLSTATDDAEFCGIRAHLDRPRSVVLRSKAVPLLGYFIRAFFHILYSPLLAVRGLLRAKPVGYHGLVWLRLWGGSKAPYRARWTVVYARGLGELRTGYEFAEQLYAAGKKDVVVTVQSTTAAQMKHATIPSAVMPFNNPISVAIFLWRWRPKAVIAVEKWFLPHLAGIAALIGLKTAIFNVAIRESVAKKLNWRTRWRLKLVSAFFCQSDLERQRLMQYALVPEESIAVTGLVCVAVDPVQGLNSTIEEVRAKYQREFQIDSSRFPVIVAGSTYHDEELLLLEAFRAVQTKFPNAVLIVAPRMIDRPGGCDSAMDEAGVDFVRRTDMGAGDKSSNVYLIDATGELKFLYSIGDIAYVGGSLAFGRQAHSPVEAAAWYLPMSIGPNFEPQKPLVDLLHDLEAIAICEDAAQIAERWLRIAADDEYRERIESTLRSTFKRDGDLAVKIYEAVTGE